jgi:hypothetical protein
MEMLKWIVNVLPILTTCCFCHYVIILQCSLSMIGYCVIKKVFKYTYSNVLQVQQQKIYKEEN